MNAKDYISIKEIGKIDSRTLCRMCQNPLVNNRGSDIKQKTMIVYEAQKILNEDDELIMKQIETIILCKECNEEFLKWEDQ